MLIIHCSIYGDRSLISSSQGNIFNLRLPGVKDKRNQKKDSLWIPFVPKLHNTGMEKFPFDLAGHFSVVPNWHNKKKQTACLWLPNVGASCDRFWHDIDKYRAIGKFRFKVLR